MAATTLRFGTPVEVIAATSVTTSAPTSSTDGYTIPSFGPKAGASYTPSLRTGLTYAGTVSGTLRLYVRMGTNWFKGDSYAMSGTDTAEAVDWEIREGDEATFVVESLASGTVTVNAKAVA